MSTAICCPEQLSVIKYLSVGDYVWIKARRIPKEKPLEDDIASFIRLATGTDYNASGLPTLR